MGPPAAFAHRCPWSGSRRNTKATAINLGTHACLIRDPNDSGLQHDGGIFDTSAFGTGEVYIYVRPELSGIRHNLDQNYQLSFSP